MIQISCSCGKLVEVVDRRVVEHSREDGELCPVSGMRHASTRSSRLPSQPGLEVLAHGLMECPGCGEVGVGALVRLVVPDAGVN